MDIIHSTLVNKKNDIHQETINQDVTISFVKTKHNKIMLVVLEFNS